MNPMSKARWGRTEKENENGLSFARWLWAAGYNKDDVSHMPNKEIADLESEWAKGVDPAEYRAERKL